MKTIDIVLSLVEVRTRCKRDLSQTLCVVFDVLRATTTMAVALANGALGVFPVGEIAEALEIKQRQPDVLLAGERDGIVISKELTGSVDFDLGNSPREFRRDVVGGKTIVMSTTNGTRALCACSSAACVLISSFLNLRVTAEAASRFHSKSILLICSGTEENIAYEDVLCAGGFVDLLLTHNPEIKIASDSVYLARATYLRERGDLLKAVSKSQNGKRILCRPHLRDDVAVCIQQDTLQLVAQRGTDGYIQQVS